MNDKEREEYDDIFDSKVEHMVQYVLKETRDFLQIHKDVTRNEALLMLSGSIDRVVIEILRNKVWIIADTKLRMAEK